MKQEFLDTLLKHVVSGRRRFSPLSTRTFENQHITAAWDAAFAGRKATKETARKPQKCWEDLVDQHFLVGEMALFLSEPYGKFTLHNPGIHRTTAHTQTYLLAACICLCLFWLNH